MKHKRVLIFSLVYSLLSIAAILLAYSGKIGTPVKAINATYLLSTLAMFPFIFITIKLFRDKDNGGNIGGKEAIRTGLRFVAFSAIVLVIFQLIFFYSGFREFKITYFKTIGMEIKQKDKAAGKYKGTDLEMQKLVNEEVEKSVTPFSEVTGVLFKSFVYGLFCSFMCSVFLRRNFPRVQPGS